MSRTILQVPVSKKLRREAEEVALDYGFSSLQEIIRVFMAKLAKKAIDVSFQEVIELSPQAQRRYQKMDEDFSLDKNVYFAGSLQDFKKQLSE